MNKKPQIKKSEKIKNKNSVKKNYLFSFEEHLDKQYGKCGTAKREIYEQEFEVFKLGAMMHELRKNQGLTQEALAEKCGTTKTYISRIENNSGDIRISTLQRIIQQGFGGRLRFSVVL